jgi:hypothetical protein
MASTPDIRRVKVSLMFPSIIMVFVLSGAGEEYDQATLANFILIVYTAVDKVPGQRVIASDPSINIKTLPEHAGRGS